MARLAVAGLVFALLFLALRRAMEGRPVVRSLERLKTPQQPDAKDDAARRAGGGRVAGFAESLLDLRTFRPLKARLAQADLRLKPGEALLVAALLDLVLTGVLVGAVGPLGLVAGTALTVFLGHTLLNALKAQKLRKIEGALPDYLQGVANGIRAGYALTTSLEAALGSESGPLQQEIARTVKETRLGIPLETALADLVERTGLVELDMAVTAILVQRQVGGNLAEVLDRIQGTLRERVRIAGEVRALTAQGRLSGLIVGLLPIGIALLMSIMDPGFLAPLTGTPPGHVMLGVGVLLEVLGVYAISRVVKVEF